MLLVSPKSLTFCMVSATLLITGCATKEIEYARNQPRVVTRDLTGQSYQKRALDVSQVYAQAPQQPTYQAQYQQAQAPQQPTYQAQYQQAQAPQQPAYQAQYQQAQAPQQPTYQAQYQQPQAPQQPTYQAQYQQAQAPQQPTITTRYRFENSDLTYKSALQRWAAMSSGWQLQWEADRDFPGRVSADFGTDFEEAVKQSVNAYRQSDYPLKACVYDNKVIRIVRYQSTGNECDLS